MCKFSIITVCLNAEKEIEDTIASILNQTCSDFEYLIKDGLSRDRTLQIAESYIPAFRERSIPFRIISQRDDGIYDAMNQANREARGDWLVYMNAGDCFAGDSVLERVDGSGCLEDADVAYGDRILRDGKLYRHQKAYSMEEIRTKLPFCHQSAFTRRELLDEYAYSLEYRICSDYRLYLQMYRDGKRFVYFPETIAIYDTHGVSSDWKLNHRERIRILEETPPRDEEAIRKLKRVLKKKCRAEFMHQHLWKHIPKAIRRKRRSRIDQKAGWKTGEEMFGRKKETP